MAEGLWIWRMVHSKWVREQGWEPVVTSTVVESKVERLVLDPHAPPDSETDVWERLDKDPPTAVFVLKPDHVASFVSNPRKALLVAVAVPRRSAQEVTKNETTTADKP